MDPDQPLQLRMPFGQPDEPVRLHLTLAGMVVLVTCESGDEDLAAQYLAEAGVPAQASDVRGLTFPAIKLNRLARLPDRVTVVCDQVLAPLYALITAPSADGVPATLQMDPAGRFELSWFDGVTHRDELLTEAAAPLLLHADLPFVSTPEAWERLTEHSNIRPTAGSLRTNLDGFVEITSNRPQLVEASHIRGLFRIDDRHFGVPAAYASDLAQVDGFHWDGPRPVLERAPSRLPDFKAPLSAHHQRDLRALVDALAAYRAQAIWWDSGLGRRVFALASLAVLDAWPALVVATPATAWLWTRHCDLLGLGVSSTGADADVHLVTYGELSTRRDLVAPNAIVLDALFSDPAAEPAVRAGLRRLDAMMDAYRLAVTSSWPVDDPAAQVDAMSLLRPAEFKPGIPLPHRYPSDPPKRLREHVDAYLSRRSAQEADNDPTPFRHSSVLQVQANQAQLQAARSLLADTRRPAAQRLAALMETASAGPTSAIGPKVAATVARARRAVAQGHRVAIATRHRRTATLLSASLRGTPGVQVRQVDAAAGTPEGDLVIVRFDRDLCDLRAFDVVLLVDYPWSATQIDRAVGAADDDGGVHQVVVVHANGTIDDRLAAFSLRRRELAASTDDSRPPDDGEVQWLVRPEG